MMPEPTSPKTTNNSPPASAYPPCGGPNYDWIPDQDHDWIPDQDHGCVPMTAMQSMLLQPVGDKLHLLPAWPKEWDVNFKLHAPKNTSSECEVKNGKIVALKVSPESRRKDVEISSPFVLTP